MVPLIHFVLLPMAIFGGLGLPVLIEIYDKLRHGTAFTRHALMVFVMTAGPTWADGCCWCWCACIVAGPGFRYRRHAVRLLPATVRQQLGHGDQLPDGWVAARRAGYLSAGRAVDSHPADGRRRASPQPERAAG